MAEVEAEAEAEPGVEHGAEHGPAHGTDTVAWRGCCFATRSPSDHSACFALESLAVPLLQQQKSSTYCKKLHNVVFF